MAQSVKIIAKPPLDIWSALLEKTELKPQAKLVAVARIAKLATSLKRRVTHLLWLYRIGKITVTVGSLLVPSLTGLDSNRAQPQTTFWLIWGLSLATGVSNACISLFGIDRKYFMLKEQLTRLEVEAWLYLSLSGKYSKSESHQEQFKLFMEKCEHILDRAARLQDGQLKHDANPGGNEGSALKTPNSSEDKTDDDGSSPSG